MAYQQLSSEKYWQQVVTAENKELLKQKNRNAIKSFKLFVFTVVVLIGVGYAIQTMPTWLPPVVGFMEYYGIIPTYYPA